MADRPRARTTPSPIATVVATLFLCAGPVLWGQSLNINFGTPTTALPDTFGGATGQVGVWNQTPGTQGSTFPLVNRNGNPTNATFFNIGGSAIQSQGPSTTLPETLLHQYLVTFNPNLEVCIFIDGLANATYEVTTYAYLHSGVPSLVSVDQSTDPNATVGGTWSGSFQPGLTHWTHTAEVTNGSLDLHSGIPAGGSPQIAALNAIQIRRLPNEDPFLRGDANQDGSTNVADAVRILQALFSGPITDECRDASDINDDGSVDIADPVALLDHLFGSGAPLPIPTAACGSDPTNDALRCDEFTACP